MVYGFVLLIGVIAVLFYLLVIYREVPGAVEQRLGVLEALPQDVGRWRVDEESEEGRAAMQKGLRREERLWHDADRGLFGRGKLVQQVRYKNAATNEVVRVEPEIVVKRRRIKR